MCFQLFVDNDGALCCAENTRSGIGFRLFISFNENKENIVLYKHQPCLFNGHTTELFLFFFFPYILKEVSCLLSVNPFLWLRNDLPSSNSLSKTCRAPEASCCASSTVEIKK